jgi:hypothetical protein
MKRRPTAARWPALVASTLLAWSASARAAEPGHDGLLLRLGLGADYSAAVSDDEASSELRGGAGLVSLDLGLSIAGRLAFHARATARKVWSPEVKIAGVGLGTLERTSLSSLLLAPALTYYAASNWYLTGAVGPARASVSVGGVEKKSLIGYGFEGDLGREWGTGGDFALGIGGRVSYYSVPQVDGHVNWLGLGLLLTATYH